MGCGRVFTTAGRSPKRLSDHHGDVCDLACDCYRAATGLRKDKRRRCQPKRARSGVFVGISQPLLKSGSWGRHLYDGVNYYSVC